MEILDGVFYVLAGWRFLLAPDFRRRTLQRWQRESGLQVMQDVAGGIAGIFFSILVPLFVWWHMQT